MKTPWLLWMFSCTAAAEAPLVMQQAPELGVVAWQSIDRAAAEVTPERPLLVLFDEVPGCSTVLRFGHEALSHPILADALETLFTPALVLNNVDGRDRQVLEAFGEPAWNNPVVRVLDADGGALVPRFTEASAPGLARLLVAARQAAGQEVPSWLEGLQQEDLALPSDLHTLGASHWAVVPMTALQATRADGALRDEQEVAHLFSPRQRWLADVVQAHPQVGWPQSTGDLASDWLAARDVALSVARRSSYGEGP